MKIHAHWDWCSQRIEMRLVTDTGPQLMAAQAVWSPIEEGCRIPPAFELDTLMAQQLMDQLWQCGLRPTEGTGSAGALAATQKHLDDMRKLVFDH